MKHKKLRVLYQMPTPNLINAGFTIYHGYKNAFIDLGYDFRTLTPDSSNKELFENYKPDILITSMNPLSLKYLDFDLIKKQKRLGLKIFVNIPYWNSSFSKLRINETPSISKNKNYIKLIKSGDFGDIYFNVCEQGDPRMEGFEKTTSYKHHTVLLASDKIVNYYEYAKKYKADISFVGTLLPGKVKFFQEQVYPLKRKYNLKIYGQDWTMLERIGSLIQKTALYFDIPILKSLKKSKLTLDDERKIYSSSLISINVHEDHQRRYGMECNERTFKIPLCGGFEICDNVACIYKYFKDNEEIIIAKDRDDWFDKIDYFIKNPNKRLPLIEAGRKRVLKDHTYHNRVEQFISLYNAL